VFGFTFDTTGPAAYGPFGRRRRAAPAEPVPVDPPPEDTATAREEREAARSDGVAEDETVVRDRERTRTGDYERTRSD
jgi:hypothetical protein